MVTLVRYRACEARSQTCCSMDLPPIEMRAFPGNREEAYRAGITPRMRSGTLDSSKLRAGLVGLVVSRSEIGGDEKGWKERRKLSGSFSLADNPLADECA